MIYLGIVLVLVAAAGVISGGIFFGIHPMLIIGGTVGVAHALWLIFLVLFFMVLAELTCVVSLVLLFSVITNSSLAAAILTMVIILVVQIVLQFSYFAGLRPYWFLNHFDAWFSLFRRPVDYGAIRSGRPTFAAYTVPSPWCRRGSCSGAAISFRRRKALPGGRGDRHPEDEPRAMRLERPRPAGERPLALVEMPVPHPGRRDRSPCTPAVCATPTCTRWRASWSRTARRWCPAIRSSARSSRSARPPTPRRPAAILAARCCARANG